MKKSYFKKIKSMHWVGVLTLILLFPIALFAQSGQISGVVLDGSNNEGLPSVTIRVKGTQKGTTTDVSGNFKIEAAKSDVLVFSYIGFKTQEVVVGNQTTLKIALAIDDLTQLSEVVVVGYGTQRKEAVTGSVISVSGDKIREIPAPNISQALQGRMPGVEMSQTSTKPGATMQIRIRGTRSLSADNNPLIVLDGIPFPGSLADLNPNDIKSIDILKDASATAIYGSRGANGVILITTEKGQKGKKPKISYNGYYGTQSVFSPYPMMDGPTFAKFRKDAGLYSNGIDETDNINTNWQDLFYRDGVMTDHSLSLSGGTETGNYNFGGGYYYNQGVIPTQDYGRYSLRGSIEQKVNKFVKVGFNTNSNYNFSNGNQIGVGGILSATPISNPYNGDGTLKRTFKMALDEQFTVTRGVVEDLKDVWLNENKGYASYNSFYGEVNIPRIEGLKYRTNLGLDFIQNTSGNYTGEGINNVNPTTISTAGIGNSHTYHWTVENILSYDRTFAQKHNLSVVALYSAEQNKYNRSSVAAKGIPSDDFMYYNLGQATGEITVNPNDQDYQMWGLMSGMGRVMYSYNDRYMASATLRSDGSSRLADGYKWHTYPAVSLGWNIMKEPFMVPVAGLTELKLRVGYGQTSNQAISPYATLGRLSTRPYNFGPTNYAVGYYVSTLPNKNLGWEYSETWNAGLDFGLLKDRLTGKLEYYITNTKDILLGVGLPATSGVSSYTANIGQTQNKGIELDLNGSIIQNKGGFTWDAGVNFYLNKNKLVALASGQTRDEGNAWFVGYNINAIYDYEKIGLWQEGDANLTKFEPGGNIGMIKVKYTGEFNEDGTPKRAIGAADRQIMNVDPKFQGGFNTRVTYKGFDLSLVGLYRVGGILISNVHGPNGYINLLTGRRNNIDVDYWTADNTDAKYPKPGGIQSGDNAKYASTLAYFDGSFLKIRTITLGHDLNKSLLKNSDIKMRLYATVQNPFVMFSEFHKESGLDPETNSYGNENVATGGYQRRLLTVGYNTPSTRNYVLGFNLTF
ncbi:MAG: TonB-dependent receptor [Cytophagaceae bacterium]|nr:TonB-dependent receptor [Cytophagaceae bacterium]MBK9934954.1 TonB-dependent receptor [Cytophagaceae bacterium]MBL0301393.1 TonB-dependent receptor [Cytophagaceae bacterium]MBL0324212.1 TonB-dependent receptor [Cytophagaceae bacterium]